MGDRRVREGERDVKEEVGPCSTLKGICEIAF